MSGQMEDARAASYRIVDAGRVHDVTANDLYGVIEPANVASFAGKHAD